MTTHGPAAPAGPGTATRSPARFRATACTLFRLLTGTNLPTPLYRGDQQEFGFSPLVVTLVFAVYVAALIPSLLIAGPLSDSVGRRTVLLPAVVLAALGSLVLALADGVGRLIAARLLQGLAVGAASGALTAALTELEPGGDPGRAALVSTVASVGGLGCGPADHRPAGRVRPLALRPALRLGDRAADSRGPRQGHPPRHPAHRPLAPAPPHRPAHHAEAVPGRRHGELPRLLRDRDLPEPGAGLRHETHRQRQSRPGRRRRHPDARCSALAQIAAAGRRPAGVQVTGLVLLAVAGGLSSLPLPLPLLLAATVIGGAGQGLTFLGAVTEINRAAPQGRHADVLSSFYVVVYLGVGIPVVGVGFLATATGLLPAVRIFTALVATLCLSAAAALSRRRPHCKKG
ncbi:MFS transporter [Streptomyces sp. NPDC038707]|uniref:MFS transporter n=1 Tax=Streptomyces sp. NPDC038707 TaxID=3154329 RepID=UPI0033FE32FF